MTTEPKEGEFIVDTKTSIIFAWRARDNMHIQPSSLRLPTDEERDWFEAWNQDDPKRAISILPFITPFESLGRFILNSLVRHYNVEDYGGVILHAIESKLGPDIILGDLRTYSSDWLTVELLGDEYHIKVKCSKHISFHFEFNAVISQKCCDAIANCQDSSFVDFTQVGFEKIELTSPFEYSPSIAHKSYKAILSRIKLSEHSSFQTEELERKIAFWELQV